MKPDYYGIKIKSQETGLFEMYPTLFTERKFCEEVTQNLKKLSSVFRESEDIQLVEIWDPDRTSVLKDDGGPKLKMKGAEEIGKSLDKDPVQDWCSRRIAQEVEAKEKSIEWWYRYYPWLVPYVFPGLSQDKVYVSTPDPAEAKPWFGVLDPVTGKPLSPTFKCEAGDGGKFPCEVGYGDEYPCTMDSFASC